MHPKIEREIEEIFNGPIEDMLSKWEDLNKKYLKSPNQLQNNSVQEHEFNIYITVTDNFEVLTNIGKKLFKREIALTKPRLILDFMEHYWGYADNEVTTHLENTKTYKDACAMDLYQSITKNKTCPTADPYFKYDPEHPIRISLDYGIERKLFTKSEVDDIVQNQDKNSSTYKQLSELYSQVYDIEHKTFATNKRHQKRYADFGFHVFIGRLYNNNLLSMADEYKYAALDNKEITELDQYIDTVANYLWEAIRKNQKVLLTKSPGGNFEPLSSEELCDLYKIYYDDSKHLALPDPFLYQPK